ncbi:molecular chaperone DnaJ [Candidatus Peregrinibacteria bacterium]|nr:molecular chaperone DnaJ [Candidatus Peregrinibacteria bacterium]
MPEKDLYKILGIERGATDDQIKKAYRKLAQKFHPDKNKGDKSAEAKFKEINEAYETLSDKQKRSFYDQFGSTQGAGGFGSSAGGGAGFEGFSGGGFSGQGFDFSSFGGGFADIFESFFGGGGSGGRSGSGSGKRGPVRGDDIEAKIKIKFDESVTGTHRDLEITKADVCTKCGGTGAEPGSRIISCAHCGGTGQIRQIRQTMLGQMATAHTCEVCHGEGKIPEKKCTACHGTMRVRKTEKVKVRIPAGISNESTIRLSGKGEAGINGGAYGDLYLHITVEPSRDFVRSGNDIHSEQKIHLLQGVLGDEINVKTIYGPVVLKIPAGTPSGKIIKLKGYGMPKLNSDLKGDHYLKVILDVPGKLSRKEKELYAQLAKESGLELKTEKKFW